MTESQSALSTHQPGEVEGQVAIVTGGSSGIGRATAILLAKNGAHVAALARSQENLAETIRLIEEQAGQGKARGYVCDVTDEGAVISTFEKVITDFGGLDIVVSNAGSIQNSPIEDTTTKLWDEMFNVLAKAYFLVSRESFRYWKKARRGGSLVFVTSKNAVTATPGASAYSAAKAAEQHLARCLAEEGGPCGIRVNCVMPDGVIRGTNIFTAEQKRKSAARHGVKPEELEEYFRQRNALKVMILPEDVADAVLFFAGPRSAKITGAALTVDGGIVTSYVR